MLFKPEMINKILWGQKNQTRRLLKPGDVGLYDESRNYSAIKTNGRYTIQVGHCYAIQPGRGQKAIGDWQIRILAIRIEPLQCISEYDAKWEGAPLVNDYHFAIGLNDFISYRSGFARLWDSINTRPDVRWAANPIVKVFLFEMVSK